jgi:nickel/cobalt exporter
MTRFYPYVLACLGLLLASGFYLYVWPLMPYVFIELQAWQRDLTRSISQLLSLAHEHPLKALFYVSAASISYGFLHAIGPGHGKVIMVSYLSTHPTKVKTSLILSISAALLQALVAIVLVSALLFVLETSMREVNSKASYLIDASFVAMILLGLHLAWKSIRDFLKQKANAKAHNHEHSHEHNHSHDHSHDEHSHEHSHSHSQDHDHSHEHSHSHEHACGCGHKHHASPDDIDQAKNLKDYLGIVLSIGIRPCSGALLVLIFAKSLGIYWLGMIGAIAMGMGTGAAISFLAFVSIKGGALLRRFLKPASQGSHWRELILKLGAASFICVMGVIMMQGTSLLFSPVL